MAQVKGGKVRAIAGTTAQRSSQGSKTAAGRKRSPRERADLDGENGVVAWVVTASPPYARHAWIGGKRRQSRPGRDSAGPVCTRQDEVERK
jgi:hypothetical protein